MLLREPLGSASGVVATAAISNTTVPAGISKSSGLTTLNLAYELKNPKLAPQ